MSTSLRPNHQSLACQVGVLVATMMGLGSIIGTGIVVSIGIAAGAKGPSVSWRLKEEWGRVSF